MFRFLWFAIRDPTIFIEHNVRRDHFFYYYNIILTCKETRGFQILFTNSSKEKPKHMLLYLESTCTRSSCQILFTIFSDHLWWFYLHRMPEHRFTVKPMLHYWYLHVLSLIHLTFLLEKSFYSPWILLVINFSIFKEECPFLYFNVEIMLIFHLFYARSWLLGENLKFFDEKKLLHWPVKSIDFFLQILCFSCKIVLKKWRN